MAKEKRWHCPQCAEQGIVKGFVSSGALEMHENAVHKKPERITARAAPPRATSRFTRVGDREYLDIEPLPTDHPHSIPVPKPRAGSYVFLAWMVFLALLGGVVYIYGPNIADSWGTYLAGDPTAKHN